MTGKSSRSFLPIVLFFVMSNALFVSGRSYLQRWNVDQEVLIIGNLLLFLVTVVSFLLARRGVNQANPHAFVRAVYGSIMIKLFVCLIAAFVYISMYKENLNRPALFSCMGLYVFYTFMEVSILTRLMKKKKNG